VNCLESRRQLLSAPRVRTSEHELHIAHCAGCSKFSAELAALDRQMMKTTRVSVPDGLSERIMIAQGLTGRRQYASRLAAAVLLLAIAMVMVLPSVLESLEPTLAGDAVGQGHPAVAAISMVIDQEPRLPRQNGRADDADVQERLKFVGLALNSRKVSGHYLGRCEVAGRECDQLVLDTSDGQVSVFLLTSEHPSGRVTVADRQMTAFLSPAPSGAYIVVAASPKALRRAQKLFVRG
jgi:Protein of unknown function (DUF3379)